MDTYVIIALVVGALILFFMLRPGSAGAIAGKRPGRQLIDHFEESGKDAAGREIEAALGKQKAADIARSIAAAFPPPAPPAPSPPKA